MPRAVLEGVSDEIELASDNLPLRFDVGNACLKDGIPVHDALPAVDEAPIEPIDKDLEDRLGILLVEGEPGSGPIEGASEQPKLVQDRIARLAPPLPNPLDKGLAAELRPA